MWTVAMGLNVTDSKKGQSLLAARGWGKNQWILEGGVNSLVFLVAKTLFFHWTEWIHGYGFGNVFDIFV